MLIQTIGWSSKTIKPISTTVTVKVKPVGKNGPIFLVSLVPYEEIKTKIKAVPKKSRYPLYCEIAVLTIVKTILG